MAARSICSSSFYRGSNSITRELGVDATTNTSTPAAGLPFSEHGPMPRRQRTQHDQLNGHCGAGSSYSIALNHKLDRILIAFEGFKGEVEQESREMHESLVAIQ